MSRSNRMQAAAQRFIDQKQFAGIEWQVNVAGRILTHGHAGAANADHSLPIPTDALYRIYSMTKPVVSVLALMLIEAGRLRLYDFLPKFNRAFAMMKVLSPDGTLAPAQRPITVEDLLTHRAGFTYEFITGCHIAPGYDAIALSEDGAVSLDEMMAKLAAQPLAFQPGSQFRYSVATDVLAHVIEKATGERLDDLLREHLFEPLQMQDTGFCITPDQQDRLMPMFGAVFFVTAIALTPLSSASAILQITPLLVTIGAVIFFREKVGWRRWTAVFVGFMGVLLILRPGYGGFMPASIFALLGALFLAARDLSTRAMKVDLPSVTIALYAFIAFGFSGILIIPFNSPMIAPSLYQIMYFIGASTFGVIAYYSLVISSRIGEMSVISPFRYSRIVFAMLLAIIVLGEMPDSFTLIGASIVVASGLYTFIRESILNKPQ